MTSCVTVRITGKTGIDDTDLLLTELATETDLDWRQECSPDGRHLSGIGDVLLSAVISGVVGRSAEMVAEVTLDRVHEVIRRWRDRRLDPPGIHVGTRELPEDDPDPGLLEASGAGKTAAGEAEVH